ncbi:MAG: LysR family transcriptional regulator [Planctomycetota bacterium]
MSFRNLEIFCSVADHLSFSRAAESLQVTQSAVSQAIAALEAEVGTRLVERAKRPPSLTAAGLEFHRGAQGMLRSYARLSDNARRIGAKGGGQVSVGSLVSIGLTYMPPAAEAYRETNPDVVVRTSFGTSERVFDMVSAGEVDFGLVSFARGSRDFTVIPWLDEPMRVMCAASHPFAKRHDIEVSDLADVEMIGFNRNLRLRQEIDRALSGQGVTINVSMAFDNTDSMIRAMQATGGIGILPEAAARRETADGALRVVACRGFRMSRPLSMAFRRGDRLSAPAAELGALLLGKPVDEQIAPRAGNGNKPPSGPGHVSVVA